MIILPEDKNIISILSMEDAHSVFLALFSEDDDLPEMSALARMAYTVIRSKSERISKRKSNAGKSGGFPKHKQNQAEVTEEAEVAKVAEVTEQAGTTESSTHADHQAEEATVSVTDSVTDSVAIPVPYPLEGRNPAASESHARMRATAGDCSPHELAIRDWCAEVTENQDTDRLLSLLMGEYTRDQRVFALEYLQRRKEQGVLKNPYEYAVSLLADWGKRGLQTREELETNRLEYVLDSA